MHDIEEGLALKLNFQKLLSIAKTDQAVIPVVVQDISSKAVLILAYANREALVNTLKTKKATFWSTSRQALWVKGDRSGDRLDVVDVFVNCEQNSLLYLVHCLGQGACHTKDKNKRSRKSCYYRKITGADLQFVKEYE